MQDRDFVDVIREFPDVKFERGKDLLSLLIPITPRLYSIASSQRVVAAIAS